MHSKRFYIYHSKISSMLKATADSSKTNGIYKWTQLQYCLFKIQMAKQVRLEIGASSFHVFSSDISYLLTD